MLTFTEYSNKIICLGLILFLLHNLGEMFVIRFENITILQILLFN